MYIICVLFLHLFPFLEAILFFVYVAIHFFASHFLSFTTVPLIHYYCSQLQVKLQNTDETVGELLPLMDRTTRLEAHSRYDAVFVSILALFLFSLGHLHLYCSPNTLMFQRHLRNKMKAIFVAL